MKSVILMMALATVALAQTNKPFVRGTMEIRYGSRLSTGAPDVYALDLNVDNSVKFKGHITNLPVMADTTLLGKTEIKRSASMNYQLVCAVFHPRDPEKTLDIGRLYGRVPISAGGIYDFRPGTLKVSVNAMGRAQAFESCYAGTANGKPLIKVKKGGLDALNQQVENIKRKVNGKLVSITVTNGDRMTFVAHKMAAGPVQYYPDAVVDGGMIYDGDRAVWFFRDVAITYSDGDGNQKRDRLSGNIRWIEQPKKGSARDGEYQFDVRLNEPPTSERDVTAAPTSEDAFFETDTTLSALTGTMKYKDSFTGEKVTQSSVAIDLAGNKLSRQQTMNLTKLILLSAIVPLNAE